MDYKVINSDKVITLNPKSLIKTTTKGCIDKTWDVMCFTTNFDNIQALDMYVRERKPLLRVLGILTYDEFINDKGSYDIMYSSEPLPSNYNFIEFNGILYYGDTSEHKLIVV